MISETTVWLLLMYSVGTVFGIKLGKKIAYKQALVNAIDHTILYLIQNGYVKTNCVDGKIELVKSSNDE